MGCGGIGKTLQNVQGLVADPTGLSNCLKAPGKVGPAFPGEPREAKQEGSYWGSCHSNITLET